MEASFYIGPHIGYIKSYFVDKGNGVVVSIIDGKEYLFHDNSISAELSRYFAIWIGSYSEEGDYLHISGHDSVLRRMQEKQYFEHDMGHLVVAFRIGDSKAKEAVGMSTPKEYLLEFNKRLLQLYTRNGNSRYALYVLFKAIPILKYCDNYRIIKYEHMREFGTSHEIKDYVNSIDIDKIINSFSMQYYYNEYSYTPPFGEPREYVKEGINVHYDKPVFPNAERRFYDCYLEQIEEQCKSFCPRSYDKAKTEEANILAKEYIRSEYDRDKHNKVLAERIPVKLNELSKSHHTYWTVNDIEKKIQKNAIELRYIEDDSESDVVLKHIKQYPDKPVNDFPEILDIIS